jgi:hypothetical protein
VVTTPAWDSYETRTDALHENQQRIAAADRRRTRSLKYQRYMQDYLATVQSVDDSVGRVLALLDTSGLARNTIVIAIPPWLKFLSGCVKYRESLERERPDAPVHEAEAD